MKQNKLDEDYLNLVDDVMTNGVKKSDRTGTGTISVFGKQIRHKMSDGFPILTSKHMSIKNVAAELDWFLSGSTDIRQLWKRKCYIWDGDWYKNYSNSCSDPYSLEQMIGFGLLSLDRPFHNSVVFFNHSIWDLGPIYGKQWTDFDGIDQISNLVLDIQDNPDSRRLMVSAWNPAELNQMVLPPCHYGFQCYTRELSFDERVEWLNKNKSVFGTFYTTHEELDTHEGIPKRELSLSWNQRSVDLLLGLPYNITSYGLLLTHLCHQTNCVPGELIGNLGDTHIYLNQIDNIEQQKSNETFPLPTLIWHGSLDKLELKDYKNGGKVKYPLSN